jgi:hypothetical protein
MITFVVSCESRAQVIAQNIVLRGKLASSNAKQHAFNAHEKNFSNF